ncbi:hypothetical protein LVY72_09480 [Arthrobacter sp. I2-34]|uniref:DUF948 domain-containing protein n=1 Tax=Arthrobacter hankyongi TaxID=2904801 RepID=A0ABS9L660_9MICC|nr:hypothetical protein [Arthrobacter hankyongi]MCG2622148.1 hypothetical protein [Arthrobacter hankyongi]
MPFWFWILLWVALCAVALLFVIFLGWRIFRAFMATLAEFEQAAAKFQPPPAAGPDAPDTGIEAFVPAVFLDPGQARADFTEGKDRRRQARRDRRVARRAARGQRQSLSDIGLT